ncbi:MAG: PHP domain-containing protein [Candidatus Riflebacteria bacterium]|nr:PHP domain-containing protein [Candidatus Riflebacteria bacterium]
MKSIVYADLHTHTTASDGTLSPAEVVRKAKEIGLNTIAITDHDTLSGFDEAFAEAKIQGINVVPGIEISCGWEGRDSSVHVVGLFIDPKSKPLTKMLNEQKKYRFTRALKILQLLENEGINTKKLLDEFNSTPEKVLGRPHIARYLVENDYVKDFQQAFEKYLLRGRPAYVPKQNVLPETGVEMIHKAGGLAIIAHPGLIPDWDNVWNKLKSLPWDGIEVYYSEHKNSEVNKFLAITERFNLVPVGGSDYHGEYGKHSGRLGTAGLTKEQYDVVLKRAAIKELMN